MIETKYNLKSH